MQEKEIAKVAAILARWNPLGDAGGDIPDLEGYRTEAIDIICALKVFGRRETVERIVMDVLNQAFDLSLTPADCAEPANKILGVLSHARKPQRR